MVRRSRGRSTAPAEVPFSFSFPYPSRRVPVMGRQAVAASHGLAAQAGLGVLEGGGNAVDAAVAAAAVQVVVEPTMNGVGGDLFAMVWDGERLHGLNASGRAPRAWTRARFGRRRTMPALGWDTVTVPGAVSGWAALARRFGSRAFAELLAPAIRYAQEGFAVTSQVGGLWAEAPRRFRGFAEFARVFLPGGRAPEVGSWFRPPDLAATLQEIAASEGESFYRGDLARRIASAAQAEGGALAAEDLAGHEVAWVEPLGLDLDGSIPSGRRAPPDGGVAASSGETGQRGGGDQVRSSGWVPPGGPARLWELPPNGQGLAALLALGVLGALPGKVAAGLDDPDGPDAVHLGVEAMKIAFAECRLHLGDPGRMAVDARALLDPARLARYAAGIRMDRAAAPRPQPPPDHGTVYVTVADRQGRMVSLIQSNYLGFGSGVVVPGTGISLHNRGLGFSLDPASPCAVAGGARPYHTIMPGFVTRGGAPLLSFGVMGGHMQPQGHVQLVLRILRHRQNPQAAVDAPRWYVAADGDLALEPQFGPAVARDLRRRGHRLTPNPPTRLFGGAQAIYRLPGGAYCAASDPRKDGQAVAS